MHYIAESAIQETLEQYTTNLIMHYIVESAIQETLDNTQPVLIMHYIAESAVQETLEQYTTCLNNALHSRKCYTRNFRTIHNLT